MESGAFIGIVLGFLIGVGCSLLRLPLPAPARLEGALLVLTMTLGFLLTGWLLNAS